jgi:hypothetical protein
VIGVTAMIGPVPVPGGIPRSAKSRLHLYLPNQQTTASAMFLFG